MTLPHYCMDKTRLPFHISSLVQDHPDESNSIAGTYVAHDMAVRSLCISHINEKLDEKDDNEEETHINVDLEGVQIVNYTHQSNEC